MKMVLPNVFLLAETKIDEGGMSDYIAHVGAPGWATMAKSDAEILTEVAGRTCYRSFAPGLNPNVSKVREGNDTYLANVLKQKHGSVFEHATVTFAFVDVSRVLCYHPETEILTRSGWKFIRDLAVGEEILTKDPVTGVDHWSINKKTYEFDYVGPLLSSETSQWKSPRVTADHLMWAKKHDVRVDKHYKKIPASEVYGLRFYQDHSINISVGESEQVTIGKYSYSAKDLYRWLGWVASDGSILSNRSGVQVHQSKPRNVEILRDLCSHLFGSRCKEYSGNQTTLRISDADLKQWVLEKLGARLKGNRSFSGLYDDPALLLAEFFEGLKAGDGTIAAGQVPVVYCRNENDAKHFQVLLARMGRSSNVRVDNSRIGLSRAIGEETITNRLPAVTLHIHKRGESLCKRTHQKSEVYSGKVYCPHTDDGLVFVRREGRPVWSGNTHEIVRHRAGAAYSQESLRFVRLDELKAYYPDVFNIHNLNKLAEETGISDSQRRDWAKNKCDYLLRKFNSVFEFLEYTQKEIAANLGLDKAGDFSIKKKITSAMRRMAPLGLATSIIVTYNHRTLRHVIQQRTSRHAEEEIRVLFNMVFDIVWERYPNIYQDAHFRHADGHFEITFDNEKI